MRIRSHDLRPTRSSAPPFSPLLALLLLASLAGGCGGPKFGGRMSKMTLESTPPGLAAYLVPNETYLADPTVGSDAGRIKPFYKGRTPCDVRVAPYLWVYVVGLPDGSFSDPLTFNPTETDGHVTAAAARESTSTRHDNHP